MKLAIGIDTGGTYTDSVLYDLEANAILGHGKALTTYDDLTRGILQALDQLDGPLCRQAVAAGLSTTLATNACVEGKFRRTRLLLLGIDRTGIARFGAAYGLTDPDDIRYLPCGSSITGEIWQEPDWELLRANAKAWFAGMESCTVCEIYGVRNGGVLERKAARILEEETGLPAVCASGLFGGLSSLERAAGAVLNAGLLPITQAFLEAVRQAFRRRGIGAKLYIVRSDSSLMGLGYAAEHAVETLLSGPAASALGGSALTGQRNAVVVDIGGTTTDIALVEDGAPLPAADGIRVGKWKTQVAGLFSASFALGGDSVIRWDRNNQLTLGPERVIPLCVLSARCPGLCERLEQQVRRVPLHTLPLHEFLTLNRRDWETIPMEAAGAALCRALEEGPLSVQEAADLLGVDKYRLDTRALEERGAVLRAGLTPTDIMHVRGDYTAYDRRAAALAARFAANSLHLDMEAFGALVYERVSREVFYGVSRLLLEHASPYYRRHGVDPGVQELLRLQWENRGTGGTALLHYRFHMPAELVGIGGPVHLFLPEAARALGCGCRIPPCAAVANAVGAVTGRMTASGSARISPHGCSPADGRGLDYEVLCDGEAVRYFDGEAAAAAWAVERLRASTARRVRAQGAEGPLSFTVERREETAPLRTGTVKLGLSISVTAETCLLQEGGAPCIP
ncbi:hydantoinase/oxoprolinase family protein [uncultured Oscillibacter sp.]|uniref:hydantoinase/oxoprolinase family protein n=1 Tax=uncultured Oscillibacter sp. TaxID=876091 RepID=UPI0025E27526|nr:hydantoinase/oxoprolinase family protein [uncultured Oscillibacter sp.]